MAPKLDAFTKWFSDKWQDLKDWFKKHTPKSIIRWLRGLPATAIGYLAMWALRGIFLVHPEVAYRIVNKIAQYFYTPPQMWAAFINSYMRQMTGKDIDMEALTKLGAAIGGRSVMETLGETFLRPMLGLIMPDPPINFYKGLDTAERFLGVNLQFQLNAWLLHLIGDIVTLGKLKSLKDLPNAIARSKSLSLSLSVRAFVMSWVRYFLLQGPYPRIWNSRSTSFSVMQPSW